MRVQLSLNEMFMPHILVFAAMCKFLLACRALAVDNIECIQWCMYISKFFERRCNLKSEEILLSVDIMGS